MQQSHLILLVVIAAVYFFYNKNEYFISRLPPPLVVTKEEYLQEVRNVSHVVGGFIGDTYNYLRAKYFDPVRQISKGPQFVPFGINDPSLADPLLISARSQIRAWIDVHKEKMKSKYSPEFLNIMKPQYDLDYIEAPNKVLQVNYVHNAKVTRYLV